MAAADVAVPVDPQKLVDILNPNPNLLTTKDISTANFVQANDKTANVKPDLTLNYFVLNNEHFEVLQAYLQAAAYLPASNDAFSATYPEALFADRPKFKADVGLYKTMQTTMVGINSHCKDFEVNTFSKMVSLAGYIANYSEQSSQTIGYLTASLEIITADDATADQKKVQAAIDDSSMFLDQLQTAANDTSKLCSVRQTEITEFKITTRADKAALTAVEQRARAALPTDDEVNTELREKMAGVRKQMNDIILSSGSTTVEPPGHKWYIYLQRVGLGFLLRDTPDNYATGQRLAQISTDYDKLFQGSEQTMMTMISMRDKASNLLQDMERVSNAIDGVEKSLDGLTGAFSTLETDLAHIGKMLGYGKGYVNSPIPETRKHINDEFDRIKGEWAVVQRLAQDFQRSGIVVQKSLEDELNKPKDPPPSMDILQTTYGGHDVTVYSRIIFNDGRDVSVKKWQPGFPLGWYNVLKTISMVVSYNGERRLFICKESQGSDISLKRGPISQGSGYYYSVISPPPKPQGAPAQILAIVWGPEEVKAQAAYDYCYGQMRSHEPVVFKTENLGGVDTWKSNLKSCAIYYTINGKDVLQIGGQEDDPEMKERVFEF